MPSRLAGRPLDSQHSPSGSQHSPSRLAGCPLGSQHSPSGSQHSPSRLTGRPSTSHIFYLHWWWCSTISWRTHCACICGGGRVCKGTWCSEPCPPTAISVARNRSMCHVRLSHTPLCSVSPCCCTTSLCMLTIGTPLSGNCS